MNLDESARFECLAEVYELPFFERDFVFMGDKIVYGLIIGYAPYESNEIVLRIIMIKREVVCRARTCLPGIELIAHHVVEEPFATGLYA